MAHGRRAGLDLIHARGFKGKRNGKLFIECEGHARSLFPVSQC
jgi:hypothetical protein